MAVRLLWLLAPGVLFALLSARCGGQAVVSPDGGATSRDAGDSGAALDAGRDATTDASAPDGCVDVDLSTYDQSCKTANDCVYVNAGLVCSGSCGCGNAFINVSGEARYDQAVGNIQFAACPCTPLTPACNDGACSYATH